MIVHDRTRLIGRLSPELVDCTGPQLLACPYPPELELPSSHSAAMTFSPALRSGESGLRQKLRPGTTWRLGFFLDKDFSGLETTKMNREKVRPGIFREAVLGHVVGYT